VIAGSTNRPGCIRARWRFAGRRPLSGGDVALIVRTHPYIGRKCLMRDDGIGIGMEREDTEALITALPETL